MVAAPRDLFSIFVDGVADQDDEVDAVRALASKTNGAALLAGSGSSADLVSRVVEAAVLVSARRVAQQVELVRAQVKAEGHELTRTADVRMKPITNVDVATRRTQRQREAADGEANTGTA